MFTNVNDILDWVIYNCNYFLMLKSVRCRSQKSTIIKVDVKFLTNYYLIL
jgi:hypothetical protein